LFQKLTLLAAVWLLTLGASALFAAPNQNIYVGRAEKISDGDTITLLTEDYERIRVRFYGVDSPEKKQPAGPEATLALKKLIEGQTITVEEMDTDRYSRIVGLVRVKGQLVNLTLVRNGWAWLYPNYCKVKDLCSAMARAEREAKAQGLGLWREPNPIPPWSWRKGER
jgi:endonuclease YncB( thermonuclease family)